MDSDDESDKRFLSKAWKTLASHASQIRAMDFSKIRNSRIACNLLVALLISEIVGLAVVLLSVSFLKDFIGGKIAIAGALTLSYFILDAPFDFVLWPFICRRIYPRHWFKLYLADEAYFYAISKIIDPFALALQNVVAAIFIFWIGFSETGSILAASVIQIPPYVCGFIFLSAPLIIRREKTISQ